MMPFHRLRGSHSSFVSRRLRLADRLRFIRSPARIYSSFHVRPGSQCSSVSCPGRLAISMRFKRGSARRFLPFHAPSGSQLDRVSTPVAARSSVSFHAPHGYSSTTGISVLCPSRSITYGSSVASPSISRQRVHAWPRNTFATFRLAIASTCAGR